MYSQENPEDTLHTRAIKIAMSKMHCGLHFLFMHPKNASVSLKLLVVTKSTDDDKRGYNRSWLTDTNKYVKILKK